jgi:hypothetical protein
MSQEDTFMGRVKKDLFTPKGIMVTVITDLVVIGIAAAWVLVNVNFLGNDVAMTFAPDVPPVKTGRR